MDVAYNQHSSHQRRKNRSSTNLNHLSLAPLTSRLPLGDQPDLQTRPRSSHEHRSSYIEPRSVPTTPRLLSRSNSRTNIRRAPFNDHGLRPLAKSKSATQIVLPQSNTSKARSRAVKEGLSISAIPEKDSSDADWLLRAGALLSAEARDSKGQSWLVSRASSTSLTAQLEEDEEALEQELAREREERQLSLSRRTSFAGVDADDEYSPVVTRMSFGAGSRSISRFNSRPGSRAQSRRGSKGLFTPLTGLKLSEIQKERDREDYFVIEDEFIAEPDFVDVDEEVYDEEQAREDDVVVKRLARTGTLGLGSWMEKLIGWNLFAVDEDGEETDNEGVETGTESLSASVMTERRTDVVLEDVQNEKLPPPGEEEGGWKDAAWLLSVATKVLI